MKARLVVLPILLFAVSCTEVPADQPEREPRATVFTPVVVTEAVAQVSKKEACATVNAALDRLEVPLQLPADGGTPVPWTDDYREGAETFHYVGKAGPGTVGSFAEGLGGDLDRLVTALNNEQTAAARAIGDVVTNRVRNLKYACQQD